MPGAFQPTLPLRGATGGVGVGLGIGQFQPTLPLRGATLCNDVIQWYHTVSTHAPLAGSDSPRPQRVDLMAVSTHAPLAGSDGTKTALVDVHNGFNPRSPCGERRVFGRLGSVRGRVSTHAPLAGSDGHRHLLPCRQFGFQPTLPLRGATSFSVSQSATSTFQPTLPLRGATDPGTADGRVRTGFNPRSPCGERRFASIIRPPPRSFNPRSPCGERRGRFRATARWPSVSTHAPLAGSDDGRLKDTLGDHVFQPTLPLRGATASPS